MGHSAGAHMAALLTLDSRYFAAAGQPRPHIAGVIGLSGPYDFLPLLEADVQDMFGPPRELSAVAAHQFRARRRAAHAAGARPGRRDGAS